ncbi:hypothtetical protein [Arabidopsis thaliana]|uniref:Hypothtetical protein n=1 Tax=Arabidopsis thaliana TaxID=3702 RepID=O65701_ARATH|nr:hypothtetical protein [Arabidopsis thaliana]CAB78932.1 hypothtetical protein [Arabidopsis thaliana]
MVKHHHLYELSPMVTGWTICVMVLRIYKKFLNPNAFELRLVLADEWGTQIEATIGPRFSAFYFDRIKENQWKTITTFLVRPNCEAIKTTPHQFRILFMDHTIVTSSTPRETGLLNKFTPFDYIVDDVVGNDTLVDISNISLKDVIGALVNVGILTNTASNENDMAGFKLPFTIMDKNKDTLVCEAYGEIAVDLEKRFRAFRKNNVVIALAWWKIIRFYPGCNWFKIVSHAPISTMYPEPDVEEVEEIKMVVD